MSQKNNQNSSNESNYLVDEFLKQKGKELRNFILKMVEDYHHTEDIFQQTMVNVLKYQHNFRGGSQFSTWVYRIAINEVSEHMRKRGIVGRRLEKYTLEREFMLQPNKNPEQVFMEIEQRELAQKIYGDKKNIIVTLQSQGYSGKKISEMLGIKIGTVKSRSFYTKKRLESEIGEAGLNPL